MLILAAGTTLASYQQILGYGLTDIDTFMNIHEARVESFTDLRGQLVKPLTGGRAGLRANFYRPTTMLANAALRAAFGWDPVGYHAMALVVHALIGVLVALFAATCALRAGAARPWRLGALAAAFFLLHPVSAENVPAIARSSDLWFTALFLAALLVLDRAETRFAGPGGWRAALPSFSAFVVLFVVTLGVKEPGVVLVVAAPAYVVFARRDLAVPARVRHALLIAAPCVLAVAAFIVIRSRVLGGLVGGYEQPGSFDVRSFLGHLVTLPSFIALDLLVPGYTARGRLWLRSLSGLRALPLVLLVAGLAGLCLAGLQLRRHWRRSDSLGEALRRAFPLEPRRLASAAATPAARLLLLCLFFGGVYFGLFALTGNYQLRLLYVVVALVALVPALALDWAIETARAAVSGAGALGQLRALGLAAVAGLTTLLLLQSPLLHRYDEWRNSGESARLITEAIRNDWARLPAGSRIYLVNFGARFSTDSMRMRPITDMSTTYGQSYYALEAWLEDQFPDKEFELVQLGAPTFAEPVSGFHHQATLQHGWLTFNVPRTSTPYRLEATAKEWQPRFHIEPGGWNGDEAGFREQALGPQRLALAFPKSPPHNGYVLVFDGQHPVFVPLSELTGEGPVLPDVASPPPGSDE
jgi:hypothetical protein